MKLTTSYQKKVQSMPNNTTYTHEQVLAICANCVLLGVDASIANLEYNIKPLTQETLEKVIKHTMDKL